MKVIQVLRAQQIFYLDGNYFLNPYFFLQPRIVPGFRSARENLPLPKEQILYCNTEPSRPIPSSTNNVRSNQFQQPYLVKKTKEFELKFLLPSTACNLKQFRDGEQDSIIDLRATEEDKKLILELHNQLRQKVASERESRGSPGPQPAAISMPNLVLTSC
jgi:hypothetical protein